MLNEDKYDMILSFAAGGSEIVYPTELNEKTSLFKEMAGSIAEHKSIIENDLECPETLQRKTSSITLQKVTNLLYSEYQVPMFTLKLHCCEIPTDQEIAMVWRHNIHKMLNFLKLTETGVQGYVKSSTDLPLRNATVTVLESDRITHEVTKNSAHFKIILPTGDYTIVINSNGFSTYRMNIAVTINKLLDMGEIVLTSGAATTIPNNVHNTNRSSDVAGVASVIGTNTSQMTGNIIKKTYNSS